MGTGPWNKKRRYPSAKPFFLYQIKSEEGASSCSAYLVGGFIHLQSNESTVKFDKFDFNEGVNTEDICLHIAISHHPQRTPEAPEGEIASPIPAQASLFVNGHLVECKQVAYPETVHVRSKGGLFPGRTYPRCHCFVGFVNDEDERTAPRLRSQDRERRMLRIKKSRKHSDLDMILDEGQTIAKETPEGMQGNVFITKSGDVFAAEGVRRLMHVKLGGCALLRRSLSVEEIKLIYATSVLANEFHVLLDGESFALEYGALSIETLFDCLDYS